jgi:hypothetical protein
MKYLTLFLLVFSCKESNEEINYLMIERLEEVMIVNDSLQRELEDCKVQAGIMAEELE